LSLARKIDEWMDGVIKDPNHGGYSIEFGNAEHLAPNHSFRHYLKSELLACDGPGCLDSFRGGIS